MFSLSFVRDFVKNIARKLVNRISYQLGMFRRGVQICEEVPYPLAGVQIRRGSKPSTTYCT